MLFGTHFAWGVITYITMTNLGFSTPEALTGSFLSHKLVDSYKSGENLSNHEIMLFVSISDNIAVTEVLEKKEDNLLLAGLIANLPDILKYTNPELAPWMHENSFTTTLTESQTIDAEIGTLMLLHLTLKEYKVGDKTFKINIGGI